MMDLDFPNAVVDLANFYNREQEQQQALNTILSKKRVPVIIIGERRIGKTSFQNVIMSQVRQQMPECLILSIEPRGIATVDQLVNAILRRLTTALKINMREEWFDDEGLTHILAPDQFELIARRMIAAGQYESILLCIDEFDEIVRQAVKTGESEKDRLFGLIHQLIERTSLPMGLFFTVTRVPEPLKTDFPSPLITKSDIIKLCPFDTATTSGMVDWLAGSEATFSKQAQAAFYALSGGHPYFIKLLLSNLEVSQPGTGRPLIELGTVMNQILPKALEDSRARYAVENIYKTHFTPAEKRVLLYLAERQERVKNEEFLAAGREIVRGFRSLIARSYLVEIEGKIDFRIQFLGYWLRAWVEFEEELERLKIHEIFSVGMGDAAAGLSDEDFPDWL